MSDLFVRKLPNGTLAPDDEASAAIVAGWKIGEPIRVEARRVRNYPFLKKWFTLAKLAYDLWSESMPEIEYKGVRVTPSFDRFRKDLTIMCGYYDAHFNALGEPRLVARSISFANMSEDDFGKLYSKTIDVVLQKILAGRSDMSEERLRQAVDRVLMYDS